MLEKAEFQYVLHRSCKKIRFLENTDVSIWKTADYLSVKKYEWNRQTKHINRSCFKALCNIYHVLCILYIY